MSHFAHVTIHPSQFPEQVRRDLLESLRKRQFNHKFLYDSLKQTQKWLALHQAYSPSRTDPDCARIYQQSFAAAAERFEGKHLQLLGLGCGGGQKDTWLLRLLHRRVKDLSYVPSDVSLAMVLVARQAALNVIPKENCFPLVCDLAKADDLPKILAQITQAPDSARVRRSRSGGRPRPGAGNSQRLITFFGMLPNFEPSFILKRLAALVGPGELLLLSANLAPGSDYLSGVKRVLTLYDNDLTRDWLMAFLLDLGVEPADGELRFGIEADPAGSGLLRIAAYFHFSRRRDIRVDSECFRFRSGQTIRLFFSYRHTPARVAALLRRHGLAVLGQWVTPSEEEGVFLVAKTREPTHFLAHLTSE
jgi:uncharacterized SAM-dependent methyltransferase